jgi:hypothetical protein
LLILRLHQQPEESLPIAKYEAAVNRRDSSLRKAFVQNDTSKKNQRNMEIFPPKVKDKQALHPLGGLDSGGENTDISVLSLKSPTDT